MDYTETKALLDEAIAGLSPQRRTVYTLCKLEGRSYKEVSQILNISESTINDHIVKATRIMKEKYRLSVEAGALFAVLIFYSL